MHFNACLADIYYLPNMQGMHVIETLRPLQYD